MGDKFIVLGFVPYSGDFEGKPYSGMRVHAQRVDAPDGLVGIATEIIKVPQAILMASTIAWNPDLIGQTIEVFYNRYGKVNGIQVFKPA